MILADIVCVALICISALVGFIIGRHRETTVRTISKDEYKIEDKKK